VCVCIREESQSGPVISAMRVMSAKSGPVISAVRVLGRRAYIWKVLVGYGVWVRKIFGEKKTSFLVETFSIYRKMRLHLICQTFWPDK